MSTNVVKVSSVNVASLGFQASFDLDQKKLIFNIAGQTIFNAGGESNVPGICFKVTGPGGIVIASVDFNAPHIIPSSDTDCAFDLPSGFGMFGFYSLQAFLKEANGSVYQTAVISKEISKPHGFAHGAVPGRVLIEADCDIPQLLITEETDMSYRGIAPLSRTVSGTFSYPPGTLADLPFTDTPFLIAGAGLVYTGRYTINNKSIAFYDLNDGVLLKVPYVVKGYEKVVHNNTALAELLCCVSDVKQTYDRDPLSTNGKSAKQKLEAISVPFYMLIMKEKAGADATEEIEQIRKVLHCDCCSSTAIEAKPLLGVGLTGTIINIVGSNAAIVSPSVSGSTKTYAINVKNVEVNKDANDTGFDIIRTEDANNILYTVSFNYADIAYQVLLAIESDEALSLFLKKLVSIADKGISLNGINENCVITLGNCDYSLIEGSTPVKTLQSITIGDDVINAPSGLLITNAAGIDTWLNGLGKGAFTVLLDPDSDTLLIKSMSNANNVRQLTLTLNGNSIVRQFTKTCVGLVQVLNAITSYLCTISTLKVGFGIPDLSLNSYDQDGNVQSTPLQANAKLSEILTLMINAQNALYSEISNVAISCATAKALFQPNNNPLVPGDGLYGTKGNACASHTFDEVAAIILSKIAASNTLKGQFCSIASSCAGPAVCTVVNNLSALFGTVTIDGQPVNRLTINCNDADPSAGLQLRYRIYDSGDTYTIQDFTSGELPKVISGVATGRYEVGVRKHCTDGQWSSWQVASTGGCEAPQGFSAVLNANEAEFNVTIVLSGSQTKADIKVVDPNGSVTVTTHDLGGQSGNLIIPMANPTLYGNYQVSGRGVCNDSSSPRYVSDYLPPVSLGWANPGSGSGSSLRTVMNQTGKPHLISQYDSLSAGYYVNGFNSTTVNWPTIFVKIHHDLSNVKIFVYGPDGIGSQVAIMNGDEVQPIGVDAGGRMQIGGTLVDNPA
jgi:hypothetical protein